MLTLSLIKARSLKAKDINGKSGKALQEPLIATQQKHISQMFTTRFPLLRLTPSHILKLTDFWVRNFLCSHALSRIDWRQLSCGLRQQRWRSTIDPYVKVWLQFGDKRIEKRKTPIFKCTLNPVFNESFSFNVPWEKIRECSLDVMVMDFDNIGRNELIGRILLAGKWDFYCSSCFFFFHCCWPHSTCVCMCAHGCVRIGLA